VVYNNDEAFFAAPTSIISKKAISSTDVANSFEVKWNCMTTASVKALKIKFEIYFCTSEPQFLVFQQTPPKYITVNGSLVYPSRIIQQFQLMPGIQYNRKRPLVTVRKEIKFPGRYNWLKRRNIFSTLFCIF
jgi:hypothetical protein